MTARIVISGDNLDYFGSVVRQALSGDLGTLEEVIVTVDDNGSMTFSTNGYTSEAIGKFLNAANRNVPSVSPLLREDYEQRLAKFEERLNSLESQHQEA
jgi:hypothetical protein